MIKKIGFAVSAASMMISSVVLAEPIDTLTTEEGNVSIIGFTTAQDGDGGSCFVALLEYTNKTSESDSPLFNYSITAFQDGIELETGYICLDYDVWTNAQDADKPTMRIESIEIIDREHATAKVVINDFGEDRANSLSLVKENNEWRIDNFIRDDFNVKDELKAFLEEE
jgi:hypothetical protein